ncbi:Sugar diacid utilization regulator [Thermomonospora echinospora]|uniref:Sugar diacid utilization regulator n=1 Tax=Thermomonospora echinospora TaxID=1992 RepID=A0A1H6CZL9_9ACTN|nr:helix-turn-helix domain-containing protein [Thermomonospora echinospora]SEG78502.1 Sugar diacid utilization regulator [Thermomonospora echinospora]
MSDYQSVVDEVSALLRAPVTLEDREFALIAFSSHDDDLDPVLDPVRTRSILRRRSSPAVRAWFEGFGIARATGPVRTPADPAAGVRARLCLPARHEGVVYGYLWLLDDGAVDPADPRLTRAMALAARAGRLLAADTWRGEAAPRAFAQLLSGSAADRAEGARTLGALEHPASMSASVAVVWASPVPDFVPARLPYGVLAHRTPGGLALLVPLPDPADIAPARTIAAGLLDPAAGSHRSLAGVGGARTELPEVPHSWREARLAVRAARAEPRLGPVASWNELGAYRLIAAPPTMHADPALLPLLDPARADLLRTAETYLDHAGHVQRAAAALSVHRQTLYYRLSRIEALTGLDLTSGTDRLLLHLAIKTFRLTTAPEDLP